MKKVLLVIGIVLLFADQGFADSKSWLLVGVNTTELTDAAPTYTEFVDTRNIVDVFVDTVIDKGATVQIVPVLSSTDDTYLGEAPVATTIADGGGTDRTLYSRIMAPRAKIIITKTEAGTTSGFTVSIRGN